MLKNDVKSDSQSSLEAPADRLSRELQSFLVKEFPELTDASTSSCDFQPGTVAQVKGDCENDFLFLAYTKLTADKKNITCEPDMLWDALWGLWAYVSGLGPGSKTVSMPALGTLNAGMNNKLGVEGSIKLIILSYAFAANHYPNRLPEVHIVLRPQDFHRINRSDLKSFSSNLKNA
ncbi:macro domain-containing protein [Corynebacterium amycolatum]|uniref:macro domain-containing protein n=1 Tax=Corynebacterium amycolatum TaxID=43765 RepID=UPI000C7886E5|nr:macro domain-containing protein [Corynebacterium amycolatum]PLA35975.1 hypothetical protein CYJ42_04325 [Corynebacterium amycolatum]